MPVRTVKKSDANVTLHIFGLYNRAVQLITWDYHAHLVSKAGSVIGT